METYFERVRKDHFSPKTNDIYDNFKIHFDLQMKNIIPWSSTKRVDTFKRKLLSWLKLVSTPLMQRIEKDCKQDKGRLEFSRLSQKEKQLKIETRLLKYLEKRSWAGNKLNISGYNYMPGIDKFYSKTLNESKKYIFSFVTLSATKEFLKYMETMNWLRIGHLEFFKQVNRKILFIGIRKVPKNRLEDMYSEAMPIVNGKILEFSRQSNLKVRYLFISNVKSIEEFNKKLEIIFQELI